MASARAGEGEGGDGGANQGCGAGRDSVCRRAVEGTQRSKAPGTLIELASPSTVYHACFGQVHGQAGESGAAASSGSSSGGEGSMVSGGLRQPGEQHGHHAAELRMNVVWDASAQRVCEDAVSEEAPSDGTAGGQAHARVWQAA